jgi:polyhydroxybutyrate depolymerase
MKQTQENESVGLDVALDHVFVHDGIERTYKMYRPENLAHNAPLVVVLHGMTSTSSWSYQAGFNELADKHGFLAVYPQSHNKLIVFGAVGETGTRWLGEKANTCKDGESFIAAGMKIDCNDGMLTTSMARWNNENADELFEGQSDVKFLSALAKSVQRAQHVNPAKTFVAGFSNGGYMSYTLMCQAGSVFHAAAIVAGLIDANVLQNCLPDKPKPVIHFHGVDDSMVPIDGGLDKGNGAKLPGAEAIVEIFANLNDSFTTEKVRVTENTTLTIYKPENRLNGAEVHYYRIENHDHVWPGGEIDGKNLEDKSGINASALIWEFFSRL